MLLIFLQGLGLGVAIAAPVGPIALLCIRRTLDQGRLIGLATGLGAATADGLYGMIAAFGLTALSQLLVNNTALLQLVGGLFLCYLGFTTYFAKPSTPSPANSLVQQLAAPKLLTAPKSKPLSRLLAAAYSSTLLLTLTNPATILSFLAIFASLGITQTHPISSVTLVLGVFTGSMGWWLVLVSGVIYLRNRLTPRRLADLNQASTKVFGALLLGFGIAALIFSRS
jgi:threonine/homoserine/homoserine lactone efflux protein